MDRLKGGVMGRTILFGLLITAVSLFSADRATVFAAEEPGSAIREIDSLYFNRDQGDFLKKGEEACDLALKREDVSKDEVYWRLARFKAWEGNIALEKGEKLRFFQETEAFARMAIEANPSNPEGHYWLGVAYGRRGEVQGILKSLSLVDPIKKEMAEALELNPNHAGAHHLLGIMYRKLPWFKGGSSKKSLEELKKASELNGTHTLYRIDLAKSYLEKDLKVEALAELKAVIGMDRPFDPVQARRDKKEAAALLENNFPDLKQG